jgi:anaerobic magnesium-protoporphyrin IX monomethyl ester cyclase
MSEAARHLVLVNPSFQAEVRHVAQTSVGPPLGLAYLAAAVRAAGWRVSIVDANAWGLDLEQTVQRILALAPDVVGATATTPTVLRAGEILAGIKAARPRVSTLLGGPHGTHLPARTLEELPGVDVVFRGEAEESLPRVLGVLAAGTLEGLDAIPGIAWRRPDGGVGDTGVAPPIRELDGLAPPARDLLPMDRYRCPDSDSFTTLLAMRGCPFPCVYCAVPSVHGARMRFRSPQAVVDEIAQTHARYGTDFFSFLDDTFTTRRDWVLDFAERMRAADLHRRVRWICLTRVDLVDADLLAAMRDAGCVRVELGIESGSARGRAFLNKGITPTQVIDAFRLARAAGLSTMGFVILNIPGETREDIEETFQLARSADPDFLQVSLLTPYPGTELHRLASENGWIRTEDWSRYSFLNHAVLENPAFSPEEVRDLHQRFLRRFYYRPRTAMKLLRLLLRGTTRLRPLARTITLGLRSTLGRRGDE